MNNTAQQVQEQFPNPLTAGFHRTLALVLGLTLPVILFANATLPYITVSYFRKQDLPVLLGLVILLFVLRTRKKYSARCSAALGPLTNAMRQLRHWQIALCVTFLCAVGVWLVFGAYAVSMDEFWAQADGVVLGSGAGLVRIAAEWRDYATALQPIFARITPDGWWASEYLPVNAAIQYLGGPLASPLLTGFAVLVAGDLARRLLPDAPLAPVFCALLMATSSQLLITGMTPYAMSAHLALNLAWLWLFLCKDWRAQLAAAPLPLLAIGLHQVVFFPLFAAPFLLHAWFSQRRKAAVVQAVAIMLSFLFWSAYDAILYSVLAVAPVTRSGGGSGTGIALLFSRFMVLINDFSFLNIGLMAFNLIRFITWQNVLLVPVLLVAAARFGRMPGIWRAMLAGIVLTIVAMTIILAFQGHGWGYRYLHGQLGSACLVATFAFFHLPDAIRRAGQTRTIVATAFGVSMLLVPVRAWQAYEFAAPYRNADAAISALDVDVVLVDAPHHVYAIDLVRNDPLLRNRPKRMTPQAISDAGLDELCRTHSMARFTDADAERFGLPAVKTNQAARILPVACTAARR